jgi:hypothetical protein
MTARQLYRGILKMCKTYPSIKRVELRESIVFEVGKMKKVEGDLEKQKAIKKMRMLYGHLFMWNEKMQEVNITDSPTIEAGQRVKTNIIEDPLSRRDLNRR